MRTACPGASSAAWTGRRGRRQEEPALCAEVGSASAVTLEGEEEERKEGRSLWGAEEIWEPPELHDWELLCFTAFLIQAVAAELPGLPPSPLG